MVSARLRMVVRKRCDHGMSVCSIVIIHNMKIANRISYT